MPRITDWDLETDRFGPSNLAPKPICMALHGSDGMSTVVATCEPEFDDLVVYALESDLMVNTNIAYDMAVILAHRPKLQDKVWKAYRENRVSCLVVREKLMVLADTGDLKFANLPNGAKMKLKFSQADMEKKYLGIDRTEDKNAADGPRQTFSYLEGKPASEYPKESYDYVLADATNGYRIFEAQQAILKQSPHDCVAAQFLNTRASLALYLSSCWGFAVDHEEVEKLYAEMSARYHEDAVVFEDGKPRKAYGKLLELGILSPSVPAVPYVKQLESAEQLLGFKPLDWAPHKEKLESLGIKFKQPKDSKYNTKPLKDLVETVSKQHGIEPKLTDTGEISCDEEVRTTLTGLSDALDEYNDRQEIQKLVTTSLPRMRFGRVHPKYDILKETGRTSSYGNKKDDKDPAYPAENIQQVDPRVRHAYVAQPGHVLCSVDYNYIELVSIAQKCMELFGQSVLADKINAGMDPHAFLGAQIYDMLTPGFGTGDLDQDYAKFMQLKQTDRPVYKLHRDFAKPTGLGFPGGLGAATFLGYAKSNFKIDIVKIAGGLEAALELAKGLKERWHRTYPEMKAYFKWITEQCRDLEWSSPEDDRYCYISPHGMVRRNCFYTEATNGCALQTPTAEGAKIALWDLAQACYDASLQSCLLGCHMVAFIHDEVIVELPLDDLMHERAFEVARIMREGMSRVMTRVKVGAEPACMLRWSKAAEAVFDQNGRLGVWIPKPIAA